MVWLSVIFLWIRILIFNETNYYSHQFLKIDTCHVQIVKINAHTHSHSQMDQIFTLFLFLFIFIPWNVIDISVECIIFYYYFNVYMTNGAHTMCTPYREGLMACRTTSLVYYIHFGSNEMGEHVYGEYTWPSMWWSVWSVCCQFNWGFELPFRIYHVQWMNWPHTVEKSTKKERKIG